MVEAIVKEIALKENTHQQTIDSVYFGGGTPSILHSNQIEKILQTIATYYQLSPEVEITLEANPDDVNPMKFKELKNLGINRLSIGIQSFDEEITKQLNRSHDKKQAFLAVEIGLSVFNNISCDLIYGIPFQSFTSFQHDVNTLINLQIPHISNYCLTLEPQTVFGNWKKKGKISEAPDEKIIQEFEYMSSQFSAHQYSQYEISNFAKKGYQSFHNTNYWKDIPYIGFGPSAHSYNGKVRSFNVSNNAQYTQAVLKENRIPESFETLSIQDKINEHILTGIRTIWGINTNLLQNQYDFNIFQKHEKYLNQLINQAMIEVNENNITLTNKGKLLADEITANLFI